MAISVNPYTGYNYDYGNGGSEEPTTGWKKKQSVNGVVTLNTKMVVDGNPYDHGPSFEHEIKRVLSQNLANELATSDMIEINSSKSAITMDTTFSATIRVVENRNLEHVMVDEYIYEVKDKRFTHEQIQEAVMNTFPEYFL